jgi:hypothetical protein
MIIKLINIEEDKHGTWEFTTESDAMRILDKLFSMIDETPDYKYFEEDDIMEIQLNNRQIEGILKEVSRLNDTNLLPIIMESFNRLRKNPESWLDRIASTPKNILCN